MTSTRSTIRPALALAAALLILAAGIAGAATANPPATAKPPQDPFGDLFSRQRELAKASEDEADPLRAIAHWQYVLEANPNDATAKAKLPVLRKLAADKAAQYFKEGFAQYEKGNIGPAFKALLKGLAYDPSNQDAVQLIKQKLIGQSLMDYKVEPGDTLASIAEKSKKEGYDDPKLALVIARYNDLNDGQALKPGQVLHVPVLVGVLPKAAPAVASARRGGRAQPAEPAEEPNDYDDAASNAQAGQAKDLLKANKFDEAAKLAGKVLDEDPLNKDAKEVRNAANMGLGQQLLDAKKFEAALNVFGRVDATYPQQKEAVTAARSQIQDSAELSYQEGVRYFLNDDLDNAVKSFEATLKINPNHPQASKDLAVARDTRDKLKRLK
jgi:tetratricopeptide (TPR) repeat protein